MLEIKLKMLTVCLYILFIHSSNPFCLIGINSFENMIFKNAEKCQLAGACPGFLKGGGPISLGSLKKGHQILKGGVQWSDGGPVH